MANPDNKIENAVITSYDDFSNKLERIEKSKVELYDMAMHSDDPNIIIKAQNSLTNNGQRTGAIIKSMLVDPLEFQSSFGYKDKPTRLTYSMLSKMASSPFTAITINTRVNQVIKFCQPQKDKYSIGFEIRPKNKKIKIKKAQEKRIAELTEYLLESGNGGYRWGRDDFETFISKITRDSLIYDQYTFEVLENRKGIPEEFFATDASTYRVVNNKNRKQQYESDPLTGQRCLPKYAQIYNGNIEAEFYPWELCFGTRRPRTDLNITGYGFAELEELVTVITSLLWSDEYNKRFFSQGSAPKGIIRISGSNIGEQKIKEFKRAWQSQMSGVYNSWKTPIMEADKMDWIDLTKTNKDMEYSNWQEYLIKIHSALFLIDPSEMGFNIANSSNASTVFETNNESKIKYSKDKGLTPILRNLSKNINRYLINRIDPEYEFAFVGDDATTEETMLDRMIKQVSNFKTIDEVRTANGDKPLGEEGGGNLILNGSYMSWYNNQQIMKQQQQSQSNEDQGEAQNQDDDSQYDDSNEDDSNPFEKDLQDFLNRE
jgi:hypothetical protein